ncbi:DcaP family trimeric outer membrane transporter [Thermaurantiacus sp.]
MPDKRGQKDRAGWGDTMQRTIALLLLCGVAQPALAQPASIEARLEALEAEVNRLKAELAAARAAPVATPPQEASARATAAPPAAGQAAMETRVAALEAKAARPADGFRMGSTTLKLNGYVKLWAAATHFSGGDAPPGSLINDFYLPQQIPIGGPESRDFDAHVKQTRLWLTTSTPVGDKVLGGYIEVDFQSATGAQGTQRTTNAYNLAVRRAYMTYGRFLLGQDWSTFMNVGALPETTDFIGPTEGTVFVRQPLVRFTTPLSKSLSLAVAIENPETAIITPTSPVLIENDDDRLPDFVARLTATPGKSQLTFAALARESSAQAGPFAAHAFSWGISAAGKVPFGPNGRHDIRFAATAGEGIGRYVGLNFVPDGVWDLTGPGDLSTIGVVAGFGAVRLAWTDRLRSTFMGSLQDADYPDSGTPAGANDRAWSAAANLFVTPVRGLDLGIEYRHGERRLLSGQSGMMDRIEFLAKHGF